MGFVHIRSACQIPAVDHPERVAPAVDGVSPCHFLPDDQHMPPTNFHLCATILQPECNVFAIHEGFRLKAIHLVVFDCRRSSAAWITSIFKDSCQRGSGS